MHLRALCIPCHLSSNPASIKERRQKLQELCLTMWYTLSYTYSTSSLRLEDVPFVSCPLADILSAAILLQMAGMCQAMSLASRSVGNKLVQHLLWGYSCSIVWSNPSQIPDVAVGEMMLEIWIMQGSVSTSLLWSGAVKLTVSNQVLQHWLSSNRLSLSSS